MIYEQTLQDVTYPDYPIQTPSTPSTGIEEIDLQDTGKNLLFKQQPSYNFFPLIEDNLSSIKPHFEIKNKISSVEVLERENNIETISEEEIALEMIEHDFVTKMSPKKQYKIHVSVRSIKKGEPGIVEPDGFSF